MTQKCQKEEKKCGVTLWLAQQSMALYDDDECWHFMMMMNASSVREQCKAL